MNLPPLHRLRLSPRVCRPCPTGVPPPDDEELQEKYNGDIDAWAAKVDCTICLGPLGLNVDNTPWVRGDNTPDTEDGNRAWVVVCERTAVKPRGHAYHKECIQIHHRTALAANEDTLCPECREPVVFLGEPVPLPPVPPKAEDSDSDSGIQDEELRQALDAIENAQLVTEPLNYVHPTARAAFDEFVASLRDDSVVRNHAAEWIAETGLNNIPGLMQLLARDLTVQFSTFEVVPTLATQERVAAEAARLEADFMNILRQHMNDENEYLAALRASNNLVRSGAIPGVGPEAVMMWLAIGGLKRVATELVAAQRAAYPNVDYGIGENAQARSVRQGMAFQLEAIRRDEAREAAREAEESDSDNPDSPRLPSDEEEDAVAVQTRIEEDARRIYDNMVERQRREYYWESLPEEGRERRVRLAFIAIVDEFGFSDDSESDEEPLTTFSEDERPPNLDRQRTRDQPQLTREEARRQRLRARGAGPSGS